MQFSHFRVQLYPKLYEKACNYLLIYFMKCSLRFQDRYWRSKDMITFLGLGHLDYVRNHITTFVCAFNAPTV